MQEVYRWVQWLSNKQQNHCRENQPHDSHTVNSHGSHNEDRGVIKKRKKQQEVDIFRG